MDKEKEKKDKKKKSAESQDPEKQAAERKKKNIEKDIESNVRFRVMPKKYKTSSSPTDASKTKMIGAVIIGFGFLVMVGLIIAAYIYFIKPQTESGRRETEERSAKRQETAVNEERADKKQKTPPADPSQAVSEKKEEEGDDKEEEKEEEKEEGEISGGTQAGIGSGKRATTSRETATTSRETATSTNETSTSTAEDEQEESLVINAADSDGDGLFDKEEELLGSGASTTDTDGDGYDDLSEVLSLYNPVNTDKLYANDAINVYENEYLGYSLIYPDDWNMNVVGNNDSVVFAIGEGSFVNLIAQPNKSGADILSWVRDLLPKSEAEEEDVVVGENWRGLFHDNERIFYLTDSARENVYIFDYSPAREDSLDYYNLFKAMINSFEVDDQ